MNTHFKSQQGSALVLSLLFTAILVILSFSVNAMLLKEVRSGRNFLYGLKAYYGAEAGVESALLAVSFANAGDGVSDENDIRYVREGLNDSSAEDTMYGYHLITRENQVPCSFENKNEEGFASLKAGESIAIPFSRSEDFRVEYYIVNEKYPFDYPTMTMQNDVLRWKIIGNATADNEIEAIGDYIPISSPNHNAPNQPSMFGTDPAIGFDTGKLYTLETVSGAESLYLDDAQGAFQYRFDSLATIADFMNSHDRNFLMLTNILNTIPATDPELPLIYNAEDYVLNFRITSDFTNVAGESALHPLSCMSVKVEADGYSATSNYKQSLDIVRPLKQGLPFTDFVWYQRESVE